MDKNGKKIYSKLFGSTFGHISFASFFIAVISGVLLAVVFDSGKPYYSVSEMLITNPAADFIRNLHYWSAQFFLVFIILHIWDHLRKSTEKVVAGGVWLRLTVSLLAVFFVMLSGFILKGDADSMQAKRILTYLIDEIPFFGKYVSYSLLGSEDSFQLVYVHHIATATIFLWIIIIEHVKIIYPTLKTTLYYLIPMAIISLLYSAGLHDNLNPVMKGPWYFLGMQELFHYLSSPGIILIFILLILVLFYYLPKFQKRYSRAAKSFLLLISVLYFILIIIGYFFRGENWEFTMPWNNIYFRSTSVDPIAALNKFAGGYDESRKIPVVLGRKEACLYCHAEVKGFSPAHSPEAIGCASCHLGNPFTIDKTSAHKGMIKIPGNLNTAHLSCGSSNCHPGIPERVNNSIMNTMSGVVSVDRFVFDESDNLDQLSRVEDIGSSAADTHMRNLCASCHTGKPKDEYGPIGQLSRGGGCNACHLNYDENSLAQLSLSKSGDTDSLKINFHPSLTINVTDNHCFGCHSRSGRISTNYEGWHETQLEKDEMPNDSLHRLLDDGRVFKFVSDDIHHRKGMECIDCHSSNELMGDGNLYAHEENQTKVQCEDCHFKDKPNTIERKNLDSESEKITVLRKLDEPGHIYLTSAKDSIAIINTYVEAGGTAFLVGKNSKKRFPLNPPKMICDAGKGHERLTCNSCHTAWSPQCVGCHTEFNREETGFDHLTGKDTEGKWKEWVGEFFPETPTLGIKTIDTPDGKKERIDTFIPGMILTVDKHSFNSSEDKIIFKRLFAPAVSHTISQEGRSCKSCHNNPLALGYGRGEMNFITKSDSSYWEFIPAFLADSSDGLPQDAWIGFLDPVSKGASTRNNARPFSIDEQMRILNAGACLTCHQGDSKIMLEAVKDFDAVIRRMTKDCRLPVF